MKFVVPGSNVKLLGKAIHSLAKIGDDVYLEPGGEGLALRAVNSSRSAFATFNFGNTFFSSVEQKGGEKSGEDGRCKVMVRSLLLAFRSLAVLEKTVDSCTLETEEDRLIVSLLCRHSVAKQFSMMLVECDTLRAVYDLEHSTNKWTVQARVLQEANGSFLASQEEVSMQVGPDIFKMKNYTEDYDEKKQVHTELSMYPGEFELYSIKQETVVTFCLKELRSLIGFAEFLQLPITATFTVGGHPLVLTVTQPGPTSTISCVFVLATLATPDSDTPLPRIATTPAAKPRQSRVSESEQQTGELAAPPGRASSTQLLSESGLGANGDILNTDSPDVSTIAPIQRDEDTFDKSILPPPKRPRHKLFRRCFEATFDPSQIPGADKILAPDSDEES